MYKRRFGILIENLYVGTRIRHTERATCHNTTDRIVVNIGTHTAHMEYFILINVWHLYKLHRRSITTNRAGNMSYRQRHFFKGREK